MAADVTLTNERLAELDEDFRAGRGCFGAEGLALVDEVRRLRQRAGSVEPVAREAMGYLREHGKDHHFAASLAGRLRDVLAGAALAEEATP